MNRYRQETGRRGEKLALSFLRQRGYKILEQNFSCRLGEIDIIARESQDVVFVEVRTRSSSEFGSPQESITPAKIRHLQHCALFYLGRHNLHEEPLRFDLVSIILSDPAQISLIKNAF